MGKVMNLTESEQRLELESHRFHLVQDGVFDNQSLVVVEQQDFAFEVELSHAEVVGGHGVGHETLHVLVAFRVDDAALVLVDAQPELHVVHDDALVQVGDQHVAFVVDAVLRHDEQSVIFAGVEPQQRGVGKSTGAATAQQFAVFGESYVD